MEKTSKIYIAGHNGMVGSAIYRNLISKGFTNFVFTPYPQFDLTDQKTVADFFSMEKPEYVILAAAKVGGIVANNTYRAQFIFENLMIQNNIIHQSYVYGVKKLLFLGSSCIYPKNCPQPIKEEYLLTGELEYTNEPYAIAKIAGIKMCESYNIQYGTNFVSVMPTNLYGPNDNFNLETSHVLPALIRKMHLGKCLENNDWDFIRKDLKKYPIEGNDDKSSEEDILQILSKYGIKRETTNEKLETRNSKPLNQQPATSNQQPSGFEPDSDGIIPVLDGEWFEDDIVACTRDFLRATFGEATLRENLRFIEDCLGKDLRKYFLNDFYKDHLQTYKKRPIYWLVQSPKKGFSVLIYLHRYTRDTMNLVLNRYLRDHQVKLRNRLAHVTELQVTAATAKAKTEARKEADKLTKILAECEEWERQTMLPLAQARIELDLDDGVKVNYLKLGEALAPIAGLAAKEED